MQKQKVVIIIDDDDDWLEELSASISNLNCEIETYKSFEEAENRLIEENPYHLVVTDIFDDLSKEKGLRSAKYASIERNVPVIVISGKANISNVKEAFKNCRVIDFFEKKDFSKVVFNQAVRSALKVKKKRKKVLDDTESKQPLSPWRYTLISLAAFMVGLGLLILFILKGEELRNGIDYYILLIPFGLSCAAFLFGAMRSFARIKGKVFGKIIEIGGPAAIFALVVGGGIYIQMNDINPFSLTVYVHGAGGQTDVVLENKGEVVLYLGGDTLEKRIEENGKAVFPSIPGNFRNKKVLIRLRADGYTLSDPNREYILKPPCIYIEVAKR